MLEVPDRWVEMGASELTGGLNYVMSGDAGVAGTMNQITAVRVLAPVLDDLRRQVEAQVRQKRKRCDRATSERALDRYEAQIAALMSVLDLLDTGGSDA